MLDLASLDYQVEQLFDVLRRVSDALQKAGIEHRLVGGLAIYLHIQRQDPEKARLTSDVDLGVRREDLDRIREAVIPFGFQFRHAAGVDMLVDKANPDKRSRVHFVFLGEKVRPEYLAEVPASAPEKTKQGVVIAPVKDLVQMKLTSFRLKDQVHIQDLDGAGLITPEVERSLIPELLARLEQVRLTR
jgi:hypothetical protein